MEVEKGSLRPWVFQTESQLVVTTAEGGHHASLDVGRRQGSLTIPFSNFIEPCCLSARRNGPWHHHKAMTHLSASHNRERKKAVMSDPTHR